MSAVRGAGHSPALLSASDWMRDAQAEKRSRAAWFDSQTRAGAEDAPVWKSGLALNMSRAGHTQMRTRSEGKSGRELIFFFQITGDDVGFCVNTPQIPQTGGSIICTHR